MKQEKQEISVEEAIQNVEENIDDVFNEIVAVLDAHNVRASVAPYLLAMVTGIFTNRLYNLTGYASREHISNLLVEAMLAQIKPSTEETLTKNNIPS